MASSPDATAYSYANFGVTSPMAESPDATLLSFENFGFELPSIIVVHHPPIAWGTMPCFPKDPLFLLPDDAPAIAYSFESMGVASPMVETPDAIAYSFENMTT